MGRRPKVSIVIPVYNGSDYLSDAVESALGQTWQELEVLVVNDGSDDGGRTEAIALSFGDRIRYFRKGNGGVASALNRGIREMRGEYFSWLSHDDLYYPDKIEAQLRVLEGGERDVVLYGDYDLIDGSSRPLGTVRIEPVEPRRFRRALVTSYPVNGCTVLVPRSCFEAVGLFDEGARTTQDYAMWFRLSKRYDFVHLARPLIRTRIHPAQGSLGPGVFPEKNVLYIRCLDEIFAEGEEAIPEEPLALFNMKAAVVLKKRNFLGAASHAAVLARRASPLPRRIRPSYLYHRLQYGMDDAVRLCRRLARGGSPV